MSQDQSIGACVDCGMGVARHRTRCERCHHKTRQVATVSPDCPMYSESRDKYFFGIQAALDWLGWEDFSDGDTVVVPGIVDMRLLVCRDREPPEFSIEDFLHDYLPEDWEGSQANPEGCVAINKTVNEWIADQKFGVVEPTIKAVDVKPWAKEWAAEVARIKDEYRKDPSDER